MAKREPKKPTSTPERDTKKHTRRPRPKPKADPTDEEQLRAAHRRALALADYYTRLADVLVPTSRTVPKNFTPAAERILASLPGGRLTMLRARAAEVAASTVPTLRERRATIEAVNADWAKHRGREDVALLAEHDIIAAVVEAAADADAADDVLAALRWRWPDVAIDPEAFGETVAAWRNKYKRTRHVADLLHRAGLRDGSEAAEKAVQRALERFVPEPPGW